MKKQPTLDNPTMCKVTVTDMNDYVLESRVFFTGGGNWPPYKPNEFWTNRFAQKIMNHLEHKYDFIED